MKFGVHLPHFGPLISGEGAITLAQRAEALGFDSVWVSDHLIYPEEFIPRFGEGVYEAITTLTWVGASTITITLGTGVLIAPYRNPLVLAKQIATLDALSGGRTVIGIGTGWMEEEFAALGADYAARGAVTNEHLEVMLTLWRDPKPKYSGPRYTFPEVCAAPRPAQAAGPPVWIGGNSAPALQRAAAYGDGWFPIWHAPTGRGFSPCDLQAAIVRLGELSEARGRNVTHTVGGVFPLAITDQGVPNDPLAPLIGDTKRIADNLATLAENGLDHAVLSPFYGVEASMMPTDIKAIETLLERFATEVRPLLA